MCLKFCCTKNISRTNSSHVEEHGASRWWPALFIQSASPSFRLLEEHEGGIPLLSRRELLTRGWWGGEEKSRRAAYSSSRVGIAQATQTRLKSGTPYCFPPKYTVGEPFTSCSTHTRCRHVTRGIWCIEGAGSSRLSRQNSGRWLYITFTIKSMNYEINERRMFV